MNISEAIAAVEAKTVAAAKSVEEHFTLEGLTIGQWRDRAIKAEGDLRTLIEKVAEMEKATPKAVEPPNPPDSNSTGGTGGDNIVKPSTTTGA